MGRCVPWINPGLPWTPAMTCKLASGQGYGTAVQRLDRDLCPGPSGEFGVADHYRYRMADDIPKAWVQPLAEFQAYMIQSDLSPRTWELRAYQMGRFAKASSGAPAGVTTKDIVNDLGNRDWSPATRQVARGALVAFYRWATKYNLVDSDPTAHLAPGRAMKSDSEPATRAQIEAALKTTRKPRDRLLVRMAADAGMSALEIAQARPRDLKEIGGDNYLHVSGKAGAERDVFLIPDLADDIRARTTEHVFPGHDHGHIAPATVSRYVSKALPEGVTAGSLRLAHKTGGGTEHSSRGWREGQPFNSPDALTFLENPDLADSQAVAAQIRRLKRDLDRDPAAAIGACKELLESLFGAVLDAYGVEPGTGPFPQLFSRVAEVLKLPGSAVSNNAKASEGIDTLGRALWFAVWSVARVRNEIGTGHGHDDAPAKPRDARLVFNATVALAEYISDIWRDAENE